MRRVERKPLWARAIVVVVVVGVLLWALLAGPPGGDIGVPGRWR